MTKVLRLLSLVAFVSFSVTAVAADLDQPTGDVLLTVTGEIMHTNGDGVARFDAEMLKALGEETVTTSTIWTDGVQEFLGTPLKALIAALGVTEGKIVASAINAYSVEIPLTDAIEGGALVAHMRNGEAMNIRDKGPLWVIYPYDNNPEYQTAVVYSRSIWQLESMEIVLD